MTETAARLRWEPGEDGILFGYSGTLKPWVFAICPPSAPGDFWMISTPFPLGQPRYVGSEKEARNAAGRWLEEFISSLGAVFLDPPKPDPDCGECGFGLPRHDKDCSHYPGTTVATTAREKDR